MYMVFNSASGEEIARLLLASGTAISDIIKKIR
jgi:biotin operon repressor